MSRLAFQSSYLGLLYWSVLYVARVESNTMNQSHSSHSSGGRHNMACYLAVVSLLLPSSPPAGAIPARPNFVFVLADVGGNAARNSHLARIATIAIVAPELELIEI